MTDHAAEQTGQLRQIFRQCERAAARSDAAQAVSLLPAMDRASSDEKNRAQLARPRQSSPNEARAYTLMEAIPMGLPLSRVTARVY